MNKKRNRFFSRLGLLAIASMIWTLPVPAQNTDQKIKALEQRIVQLEQRIAKLEGTIQEFRKEQAKPAVASPAKWKDKANWRLLRKGMTKQEVERILGVPPKMVTNAYYGDIWYYPDLQGGNASFDKDDILTSWGEI